MTLKARDGYQVCSRCRRELPTSEYNKQNADRSGFQRYCRACFAEYLEGYGRAYPPPLKLDIFQFVEDWETLSMRELSIKYLRSESRIYAWASWLRGHGHNLAYKKRGPIPNNKYRALSGGRKRGPRFDRARFVSLCKKYPPALVAAIEGIAPGTVRGRATQCRKEGWK